YEDNVIKKVATDMGRGHTWKGVNVGVYYGDPKTETDPYFNGLGPLRHGCKECAACMIGCRYNAKNTLDKNYLWFAEKYGAEVFPETLVTKIEYADGIYTIHTQKSTVWGKKNVRSFRSKNLVVSGGVLGTMDLLLRQKHLYKTLPNLSDRLGQNIRTNSKSMCGVSLSKEKLNNGVSITSIFAPDDQSHIEIIKYPDYGDGMKLFATLQTGKGPFRGLKMIGNILTRPVSFLRMMFNRKWAQNSMLIMVMQVADSAMDMKFKKFPWPRLSLKHRKKDRIPVYNEIAQEVTKRFADEVGGIAANSITEVMFNMSTGDHIMGGSPMGETANDGVVNKRFEAFGYPGLYILDGTIIPCNLGVNPSLTITALSEYAMDQIPEKEGNKQRSLEKRMAEVNV
ncbi:MAG: GMC oxidoreductase, partial [Flavobacteriales bacterium]|nr:GMC oxidoreductase [Flavobacteriales bacterium]